MTDRPLDSSVVDPAPSRRGFWRDRVLSTVGLVSTVLILLALLGQSDSQREWLRNDYGIDQGALEAVYAVLLAGATLAFAFEPRLRAELRDGRSTGALALGALLVSVFVVAQLPVDQPTRLTRLTVYPVVAAHVVLLCVLALLLTAPSWRAAATRRTTRYGLALLLVLLVVLVGVHILGVGHFVRFDDLFDEVYKVSSATNFATNGLLSPSFSASPYGNPDPSAARYYVVMGLWLRAVGESGLIALRTFPLLVGFVTAAVTAVALWRMPQANGLQKLAGLVVVLGASSFLRMSHNLRNDIGLALCGALVLLFWAESFRNPRRARLFLLLTGLSLWVGMENIPTVTLVFGLVVGLLVIVAAYDTATRRLDWRAVLAYAGGAAVACAAYAAVHYGPDIAGNLATMREYVRVYTVEYNSAPAGSWERLPGFAQTSLALSPAELLLCAGALVLVCVRRRKPDVLVGLAIPLTVVVMVAFIGGSYGYLVMLTPFAAYVVARVVDRQAAALVGVFVLLPAFVAASVADIAIVRDERRNLDQLAEWDLLTWQIPEGTTVIGPTEFWLTLHQKVNYIGWDGLALNRRRYQIGTQEALTRQQPDVLICPVDDLDVCEDYAPDVEPRPFDLGEHNYRLYFVHEATGG